MRARFSSSSKSIVTALALLGAIATPRVARAGSLDFTEDDDAQKKQDEKDEKKDALLTTPPVATIKSHAYTLEECLALTERNHPMLWAARARLSFVRAQLDEAVWTPWWQGWSASGATGYLPTSGGTPFYSEAPPTIRNLSFGQNYQPFIQFTVQGAIPLYTFGKITSITEAATAQVRYNEWDLERQRQLIRMDVRRAYFGLMLARDARYIIAEVVEYIDNGIKGVEKKLEKGDPTVEEVDRLRLEIYRDEILARSAEADRGERFAIAALRFLTGVQAAFDIPDQPLKRPDRPLRPVVEYLGAARLFRADVNLARAGVAARRALVDYARAKLYPNIGLGMQASYVYIPAASSGIPVTDPLNAGIAIGLQWNLDLLPGQARVEQAEAQLEEARALERLALGGTGVEVENAYGIAAEAKIREENWARAERRAREWIATVRSGIDLGTRDERALLEPLRAYVNARVSHAAALMDLNNAMSDLARATGWDQAAPTGN
jgi:outer membrane protein, multidrug efflux system